MNLFILIEYSLGDSYHFVPRKTPWWENNRQGDHVNTEIALGRHFSPQSSLWGGDETVVDFRCFRNLHFEKSS